MLVHLDEISSPPSAFILEDSAEFRPRDVTNGSLSPFSRKHGFLAKVFDADRLIFANELSALLLPKVSPSVLKSFVFAGYSFADFLAPSRVKCSPCLNMLKFPDLPVNLV